MTPIIDLLKQHRSIRRFKPDPVSAETLETILSAGQCAATSSFLQGTTVVRITAPVTRQRLATLAGNQAYVASAPEFLVFCADLHRAGQCCERHGKTAVEGYTEQFIIATVDVALMAQSVVLAAESLGLGACYIGAIRNAPAEVAALLELPRQVYPVFGLCLGYPAETPETKPRLPLAVIVKQERYSDDNDAAAIAAYDEHIREYYRKRSGNPKNQGWSEQMAGLLGKESRPHMRAFLRDQGFEMK
ncbi:MAG: oxygen-insensitive NADPH nitroreductase [Thiotrichales bacterium]